MTTADYNCFAPPRSTLLMLLTLFHLAASCCTLLRFLAALCCTLRHLAALCCTFLHLAALSCCTFLHLVCTLLHLAAPSCYILLHLAAPCILLQLASPCCTLLHLATPCCTLLHLSTPCCACSVLGESVLHVIGCLVPFLESEVLESLPYTVALTLATFPPSLHKDILTLLCSNLLPVNFSMISHGYPLYERRGIILQGRGLWIETLVNPVC